MSKYNYKIIYKKNQKNERVDVLNKRLDHFENIEKINIALFKETKNDKKLQFNKCYFIITNKVETDKTFIDEIKKAQAKKKIVKNNSINNQKGLLFIKKYCILKN